jgi:hypothetical protein
MHTKLYWVELKGRDHLGILGVDGRIILKWILIKTRCDYVDWINLVYARDKWGVPVSTVINFRVP